MAKCYLAYHNFNRRWYGVLDDVDDDWSDSDDSLDRLVWTQRQRQQLDTIRCWNDGDVDTIADAHSDDWSEQNRVAVPVNLANFHTAVLTTCTSMYCGCHCMVIELLLRPMVNGCARPSNYCALILLRAVCVISLNDYHCPDRDDLMMAVSGCHRLFRWTNLYHLRRRYRMYGPVIFRQDFRAPTQNGIGGNWKWKFQDFVTFGRMLVVVFRSMWTIKLDNKWISSCIEQNNLI